MSEDEKIDKNANSEEEKSLDFGKIGKFYKKNSKTIFTILLLLVPLFLSVFFRAYTFDMPITDQWAQSSVYNNIKSNILAQVNQQYPNLPDANKQKLVNEQFDAVLEQNKELIDSQVSDLSDYFRSEMQDESGQTYLIGIDPYFFYRHMENYLDHGSAGTVWTDDIKDLEPLKIAYPELDFSDNIDWDGERMAPLGADTKMKFHDYFGVYLHKFLRLFNPDQSLATSVFILPLIVCGLATIPAFFIGRKIAGNIAGFFAAIIVGLNGNLLGRTVGGFSDTDPYNIFFPLLITWFFIESLTQKKLSAKLVFAGLAGIFVGIFSYTWIGWWYIFDFTLAAIFIYLLCKFISNNLKKNKISHLLKDKGFKDYMKSVGVYLLASCLSVGILTRFDVFFRSVWNPLNFLNIKSVATSSLWPTITTTVAELNSASFNTIINSVGGPVYFGLAILGIILIFMEKSDKKDMNLKMGIILAIWFAGTIFASRSGIRFIVLLVPAFALAFGASIGILFNKFMNVGKSSLGVDKKIIGVILFIIALVLLIQPVTTAHNIAKNEISDMNDAWYDTLKKIDVEAAPDAIVNSWWDFGHWFITFTNRRVTFDGAGQDRYMAYWIGRSLVSDSEEKTIGILKMADCGNNNAFWILDSELNDTHLSAGILNNIVLLEKNEAKNELVKYVSEEKAEEVLKYSHCEAPENYYITSEDMIGKSGVWAHFGSWNFERAEMYKDAKNLNEAEGTDLLKEKFGLDEETAGRYYYEIMNNDADQWIAGWPSYISEGGSCTVDSNKIICNANVGGQTLQFITNLTNMETRINANSLVYPYSVVYADEYGINELKFDNPAFPYTIAIYTDADGNLKNAIMSPELAMSTFTKLFFFRGHGQSCFSLFDYERQITGGEIYTWKVDWKCQQYNNIFQSSEKGNEEISASHILITLENRSEEEAINLIGEIKKEATAENFADLAREYSECPSAEKGGDLGSFGKGVMVKEFEDTAFELDVGEISDPVRTQFGWHIVMRTQ